MADSLIQLGDDDFLIVSFAGHVVQRSDVDGDERIQLGSAQITIVRTELEEHWVLWDGLVEDTTIRLRLSSLPDAARVLLVLDACHSENASYIDAPDTAAAFALDTKPTDRNPMTGVAAVVAYAAGEGDVVVDDGSGGRLSAEILKTWRSHPATLGEILQNACMKVNETEPTQNASFYALTLEGESMLDRPLP